MSKETTSNAELPNETTPTPDQDWGKITAAVVLAVIVALAVHYVVFEVVFAGMTLSPTVHAFVGMIFFFIAGWASFSVTYH